MALKSVAEHRAVLVRVHNGSELVLLRLSNENTLNREHWIHTIQAEIWTHSIDTPRLHWKQCQGNECDVNR